MRPAGKRRIANACAAEGLESFRLDYADEASIAAAVDEVKTRTGGTLDALFNNGAFACPGAVEDLPRGALREIFEVNLFGYHDLARRVIPMMRAQGHGRIVNCSSVLGLVALTWRGAYVATKFAMEGLSDVMRIEMKGTGIDIILIEPGPIATRSAKTRSRISNSGSTGKTRSGGNNMPACAGGFTTRRPRRTPSNLGQRR